MKKKLFIFLLLFISLLLVGCGKKKPPVVEEKKDEVRELTEEEIDFLMNRVGELSFFDINPAKSFKVNDLTNQEVLLWATSNVNVLETSFADLEKKALDYLDFSLEPEPILCMTHSNVLGTSDYLYLYNVSEKNFIKNVGHVAHNEDGFYSYVLNRYDSSRLENDNYIITVYKLFSDTNARYGLSTDSTFERNWYSSYVDAKYKQNSLARGNNEKAQADLNSMGTEKLIKYTYTFKMKNNNYILKNYEIMKEA